MASASQSLLDQDSTVSSPLSDVVDAQPEELSNHSDDDELSDVDINSSEAETERLDITPRKTLGPILRATSTTHSEQTASSSRVPRSLNRSPTKLYDQIHREEDLSDEQEDADDEEEKASQSSRKQSQEPSIKPSSAAAEESKKRKRSSLPDHDEPARKRTGSVVEPSDETSSLSKVMSEDLAPTNSTGGKSADHSDDDNDEDVPMEDIAQSVEQKLDDEEPATEHIPTVEVEDAAEAEVDEEAAEAAAIERKRAAFDQLASIEKNFALLREKLYDERLNELLHEEALLTAENPTHPEYLAMMQCIDSRRDERLSIIELEYKFNIEAVDRWAVARRAQILSQFFQSVRESRERTLDHLGKEWYEIQHERRKNANPIPDFGLRFPKSKAQQKRQFIAHGKETSILAGVAQHHGFPAAPDVKGASQAEVEEDVEAMQRARQSILGPAHHTPHAHHGQHAQHSQHAQHPQPTLNEYTAVPFGRNLGPAGEQFLEQTPWANPRHPSHGSRRHSHGAYAGPPAFLNQSRATSGAGWFANGQTNGDAAPKHTAEAMDREPGGHARKTAGAAKTKRETLVL